MFDWLREEIALARISFKLLLGLELSTWEKWYLHDLGLEGIP